MDAHWPTTVDPDAAISLNGWARLGALMHEMADGATFTSRSEALDRGIKLIPLVGPEARRTPKGSLRGRTALSFMLMEAVQAGWIAKDPHFRITESGRLALDEFTDPVSLKREGQRLYRLKKVRGKRRAWLLRPRAGGADLVNRWEREGFVSLAATHLGDVLPGSDHTTIRAAVEAGYTVDYAQQKTLTDEYYAFLTKMSEGDLVATAVEDSLRIGVVSGDPVMNPEAEGARLSREVDWSEIDPVPVDDLPAPIPSLLDKQGSVVEITQAIDVLESLIDPDVVDPDDPITPPVTPPAPARLPAVPDEAAAELHIDRAWLQTVVDLLNDRKQVVLYGPPGTGKTFVAQRLMRHLTDRSAVRVVQFHPSYAYEDFFEGFRPTKTGTGQGVGFTLTAGPLREIASDALADPSTPHVLIIDEINRANLAKVFGELYYLLEYRGETIRLQYSPDDTFSLPPNLFLIGTMNTADRSIALVDAALRRRFAFVEMHPGTEPVRGLLPRWLAANKKPQDERAALLAALNAQIGDEDRDFQIGPAYLMKPDAERDGGLERVWEYSILPLLEEHYYGRHSRDEVRAQFGLATLRAQIRADASGDSTAGEATADEGLSIAGGPGPGAADTGSPAG